MKVLLTGSTGLVGKEVGKKLIEAGHSLVVLVRNPGKAKLLLPFPAEIHQWDGVKDIPPSEALQGVEAVIHLAGESIANGRWTKKRKKEIFDSRILGTRNLTTAIRKSGSVKTYVSASAIGIYGDSGNQVLSEAHPEGNDYLAEVCKGWETETKNLPDTVRVVNLRIGVVLARQGGALEKLIPLFSLGIGGAIGNGKQWMSWIHIDDLVRLCVTSLTDDRIRGPINAVAPTPVSNHQFSKALAKSLGRNMFFPVPKLVIRAALGEMADIVLHSQQVEPKKLNEINYKFSYPTINEAMDEICQPLTNGQRELLQEQWVPHAPAEIFPFFCNEKNLEKLTPPFLNFHVVGKSSESMQEGTLIEYKLSLHGIPFRWKSVIEKWNPGSSFVDQQITGPYKKWHHTHEFIPMSQGTLMRDRVSYSLPFGRVGALMTGWKVMRDVNTIFAYRRTVIKGLFD